MMAFIKLCPKCSGQMIQESAHWDWRLKVNPDHEIEAIEEIMTGIIRCKDCGYSETLTNKREIEMPVKLPKEFVYAMAKELLYHIYHKL